MAVNKVACVLLNEQHSDVVLIQCLWILTNFVCEDDNACKVLISQFNIFPSIEALLVNKFLCDTNGNINGDALTRINPYEVAELISVNGQPAFNAMLFE